jgi:hypothetical protein
VTAKPYDPVLKGLVDIQPRWWPVVLSQPTGPTEVIDADIATVSGAADKVLRVGADPPYLLHLEFVAGHDVVALLPKLHVRNGLLRERHALRVRSAVVLLHPGTDSPQMTGVYQESFPDEEPYLTFRYQVLRVWELDPRRLLQGGLPLLALAPISAVTEADLPDTIQEMQRRLSSRRAEAGPGRVGGGVHPVRHASLAGAGGATVPRSAVHERVFDVPSHPGRGANRRGRDRGEEVVAPVRGKGLRSPGRPDLDDHREH